MDDYTLGRVGGYTLGRGVGKTTSTTDAQDENLTRNVLLKVFSEVTFPSELVF